MSKNKKLPLTPHIEGVIANAKERSILLGKKGVDKNLLFCSFVCNADATLQTIFEQCNINLFDIARHSLEALQQGKSKHPIGSLLPCSVNLLEIAETIAKEDLELDYVSSESLLMAFLCEDFFPDILRSCLNVTEENHLDNQKVSALLGYSVLFSQDFDPEVMGNSAFAHDPETEEDDDDELEMFAENTILSEFADNLNMLAAQGKFDKVIDFDKKIDELATILCRKKKPNAILVGPAGTGKTSLVEGLALKIVNGEAPELLSNKVIYSLNLSSMIAGTQYRGQFEQRLEDFINETKKYKNLIIFIDEIHTLIGAGGSSNNSLEASNILKPELARGTISCIGATTINEYTNTIKRDSALDRRFERVMVKEPSKFQMKDILPQIVAHYENFHGVSYSEQFLDNILEYCERFLPNKFYPDKAVDIIDHCGAQAKVQYWEIDEELREKQKDLIADIRQTGNYNKQLIDELGQKIHERQQELSQSEAQVEISHLKAFFNKRTNVLNKKENISLLKEYLNSKMIGQKSAIKQLTNQLIIANYGFNKIESYSRPDSFLIYGGKLTGKTLFCEIIKENSERFGSNVLYYNGIEFSDLNSSYKILSNQSNNTTLCEKICLHPNSIIILDDFNLVHDSCLGLFSQILKEGKIQMHNGDIADFSNCKIFFTSSQRSSRSNIGFNTSQESEDAANIPKIFSSSIKHKIQLKAINKIGLRRILYMRLKDIQSSLRVNDVDFKFNFKFIKRFTDQNCGEDISIQELNNAIEKKLIPDISEQIINGNQEINFS